VTPAQRRALSIQVEQPVLMDRGGSIVLAFPEQWSLAPEFPIGSFLGLQILVRDLPRAGDEFEGLNAAASIRVPQEIVIAGDNCFQNFDAVLGLLAMKCNIDDLVRYAEPGLGIVAADLERIDQGRGQLPFRRSFHLVSKYPAGEGFQCL